MVRQAYSDLVTATVNKRIPAFVWGRDQTDAPKRLNVYLLAAADETLLRRGFLWNESYKRPDYVMLDKDAAESFVATYAHAPAITGGDLAELELSDDMRLALAVIKDWDIAPGSGHTNEAIAARVKELAKGAEQEITDRRALEIARLVKGRRT